MNQKSDILTEIFRPDAQNCQTPRQDLQLAITLSPELEMIEQAMDKYSESLQSEIQQLDSSNMEKETRIVRLEDENSRLNRIIESLEKKLMDLENSK